VKEFRQFAFEKLPENNGRFYCPCVKCFNGGQFHFGLVMDHLICHRICQNYMKWIWHGESINPTAAMRKEVDVDMDDQGHDS